MAGWPRSSRRNTSTRATRVRRRKRIKEAQAQEAKLRVEAAEKAAEQARLEKAEAEKREAEAEAREATLRAKKKTVQLWLGAAFGILVLGGLRAWNTITDQHAQASANLNAFSTLAASLPPWEGLDVAYSLAQQGGPSFRLPLAHALERMDDTSLIGEHRNVGVSSNQDGSALWQIDRTPGGEGLRIYPIGNGKITGQHRHVPFPLPNRVDSLALAQVGPPIGGKIDDRLAVLVFRDPSTKDYIVEAHHLRIDRRAGVKS